MLITFICTYYFMYYVCGMILLNIKPLSVNEAWQGKRFKTKNYLNYEKTVLLMLPQRCEIPDKISIEFIFGFSSNGSDLDNPIKPILDILQKKYNFNDRHIYKIVAQKKIVNKGNEFIQIKINSIN